MTFLFPKKPKAPPPPPSTPTQADPSVIEAGERGYRGYGTMVSTGSTSGLTRKAFTSKRSLIGGS